VLVGHLAIGLLAKRAEPRLSLGTCLLAPVLVDVLHPVFVIAGIEAVTFGPGRGANQYLRAIQIALSHSLAMNGVWAALLASAYYCWERNVRVATILFAAALSHWPLDAISHVPDMPLAPGLDLRVGLGLWTSVPATLLLEGGLWAVALLLYARATRRRILWWTVLSIGTAVLTLAWYQNIAGPPPDNPSAAPVAALLFFALTVGWGYWLNRLASPKSSVSATPSAARAIGY
jgi:hypothetical protein